MAADYTLAWLNERSQTYRRLTAMLRKHGPEAAFSIARKQDEIIFAVLRDVEISNQ